MSRFQFVADNSTTFEVKRLCQLVEVERSSYYAWRAAAPARAARAAADAALADRVRTVLAEDATYGARGSPPNSTPLPAPHPRTTPRTPLTPAPLTTALLSLPLSVCLRRFG